MKRIFLTALLGCVMTMQVFAVGGKCGEKVKWNFDKSTGALTISGEGAMKYYENPYDIPWRKYREQIKTITIENGVTVITAKAFYECRNAVSVSIPYSVVRINTGAFEKCLSLQRVYIPSSIEVIASNAFWNCASLTYIEIPNSVTCIENFAFAYCYRLSSIKIPNSVKKLGNNVFRECTRLTSVTLPDSITEIPTNAFFNCSQLSSITIPSSVKYISDEAFAGCAALKSIKFPKSVESIGKGAFKNCTGLSSLTILGDVRYIGYEAFNQCTGLTSLTMEHSLWYGKCIIGGFVFKDCKSLKDVILPDNLKAIPLGMFKNCTNLSKIVLPSTIEDINVAAFEGCKKLEYIIIPNSIKYVENDAFAGCSGLKEISYPKGLDMSKASIPNTAKKIAYDRANPPRPKEVHPPLLAMVDGSLTFTDESGNNRIDAGEKSAVRFQVKNSGKGDAYDCEARIRINGASKGIYASTVKLPMIPTGQTTTVSIPVTSDLYTTDGSVRLTVSVYEPNGFGIAPFDLTVATKAYEEPLLQVVDYNITSASGKVKQMEPFVLSFNLQNTKYGTAEDVRVSLTLPTGIFVMDDAKERKFKQVRSGEAILVQYNLIANNNYSDTNIPVTIEVKEKHGRFAENKRLDIALNQTAFSSINIAAKDEPQEERREIQKAMLTSEVDRNIPVTGATNPNTFVLIIANEHYLQVAGVPYALNDGNIFREYCIKTLGVSEKHIKYFADATGNQIKSGVNWLANLTEVFDNPQIIVYYAGHGIPDEASKSAYLLPVDGNGSDISTGYKLDDLYATLGNMPAAQITVFMDACFSGSKREQGMLASARGVALKAKAGIPQGNMVVFSAATGDETAYPNKEQQHGLFTYYLLKKLQETKGDVALKDLGAYLTKQVSQQSLIINDKRQTPTVTPSAAVGAEWQNWKLK